MPHQPPHRFSGDSNLNPAQLAAIHPNDTGRLVDFFDTRALTEAICDLLDDPATRQRLMKEGRAIESPEENLAQLTQQAQDFAAKQLPMLKALGVV